ncbi:MAG: sodium:calcium antiporter [Pseudomonadota bacterium]|nr:sodium:calcium antiporter [Pseudomonadota bacterium]
MAGFIASYLSQAPMLILLVVMAISFLLLAKSADKAIDYAVALAQATGLPNVVIGATIVSLGTTFPEAVVSVLAAIKGNASLALGNAVGSIICDTALIMGLTCMIGQVPIASPTMRRRGIMQLSAVLLLVLLCLPIAGVGSLSQLEGILLVVLLIAYLGYSLYGSNDKQDTPTATTGKWLHVAKLVAMFPLIYVFSELLIEASKELALRMHIPDAVIAATIVAFGTSLPELMTAISAIRRKACDLALGNIIGADILNVLFVAGVAASVTPAGLAADPVFYTKLFPVMVLSVAMLQGGVYLAHRRQQCYISKSVGVLLCSTYLGYIALQYLF